MVVALSYLASLASLTICLSIAFAQGVILGGDLLFTRMRRLAARMSGSYEGFVSLPLAAALVGALLSTSLTEYVDGTRKWLAIGTPSTLDSDLYIGFALSITGLAVSVLLPYAAWRTFRAAPKDLDTIGKLRALEEGIISRDLLNLRGVASQLEEDVAKSGKETDRLITQARRRFRILQSVFVPLTLAGTVTFASAVEYTYTVAFVIVGVVTAIVLATMFLGWSFLRVRIRLRRRDQVRLEFDAEAALKAFRRARHRDRHRFTSWV